MDHLLAQGERFESAQQYDRELQSFQQALAWLLMKSNRMRRWAAYYLTEKKYDQAIQEFQEAIRLSEGDDHPRLELGLAYQLKGRTPEGPTDL